MLLPKVRYSIAYRFTCSLSKGMTVHAITDYSHKPIAFRQTNDLEGILIVSPSASLAIVVYLIFIFLFFMVNDNKEANVTSYISAT